MTLDVIVAHICGGGTRAYLPFQGQLLTDVLREIALVAVGAVSAGCARELLANAPILIAVIRRRTGVQSTSDLRSRGTCGSRWTFFATSGGRRRAARTPRLATGERDESEGERKSPRRRSESSHAPRLAKMVRWAHGSQAHPCMHRLF